MGKNLIIFGDDISSFVHIDNKNKYILILGQGLRQELDNATLLAQAKYPINFTQPRKRFALSLHYNRSISFLFVDGTKIYQFKAKISERKRLYICLCNISNDFAINNIKKNTIKRNFFC